jgi:tRNA-dihydrouridine synthase B
MVDVTDVAYREVCREAGAAIGYTEMLHAASITHQGKKTKILMLRTKKESPVGIQITARNVEQVEKIIPFLKDYDLVDLNCGCPGNLTIDSESGSYLLNDPEKIAAMIKLLKSHGFTVTAKIRLGFKKKNVMEVAKAIEMAGADALTIHGRLASQGNDIPADWKTIAAVKKELKIPVICNGDVRSGKEAASALEFCDGVMIARAAIGNPFVFEQIIYYLKTGKELEFDFKKNWSYFQKYLKLVRKYEVVDLKRIKYIGGKFIREISGSAELRAKFVRLKTLEEIEEFVDEISKRD